MSKQSLELLVTLFSDQSTLQLPVGLASNVIEIREWAQNELKKSAVPDVSAKAK